MARINGIQVKNLKRFLGHEEEPLYQGTLYLGNKKLGHWSQNYMGAVVDDISLEEGFSETKLRDEILRLNPEGTEVGYNDRDGDPVIIPYDFEILMADLIQLVLDEKEFKAAVKQGYGGIMLLTDGYHSSTWYLPTSYLSDTNEQLELHMKDAIEEVKEKEGFFKENAFTKHTLKVYRSFDDFVVGEPIKLEAILAEG